ncbi:rab-GTPase-TBC domain-containing protein [Russula compacta]|nr:rab-GTPase-TBC domain-containing protein [Russula compacta]
MDASPDWDALRLQSLAPGGFGGARAYIWHASPRLLHLDVNPSQPLDNLKELDPHPDERQIRLDTDRSFVLYPVDDEPEDVRLARQAELNTLIVQVFRRRPGLSYFQGFHDIATVLQLTLPPDVALLALEKLSLHRLRDSMGLTLEPLTGLMLILQRLLRLADPPYAELLEEHAPLPYAALPHLLTLFAHAAPTLPLIKHIFDYLLVRPPLTIVYLVAAMTLLRKDQVVRVDSGGDEGMVHAILTGLPEFTDYTKVHDDQAQPDPEPAAAGPENSDVTPPSKDTNGAPLIYGFSENTCNMSESDLHTGALFPSPTPGSPSPFVTAETGLPPSKCPPSPEESMSSTPAVSDSPVLPLSEPGGSISALPDAPASFDPADLPLPPSAASTPPGSPKHVKSPHSQTAHSLLSVLLLADELFVRFPPDTPQLCLTRTLGPASAMRTWAQDATLLPSDDQAEALVIAGIDIVVRDALEPASQKKEPQQRAKKGGVGRARRGEARLLVAGAVLMLGVAVAVGVNSRRGGIGKGDWRALYGSLSALGERVLGVFGDAQLGL